MTFSPWLLFLPRVPSTPSSLRVTVWRRLRGAGAVNLQNGAWVLPNRPDQEAFARQLLAEVRGAGGTGLILTAAALDQADDAEVIEQFRGDRDQEYAEFIERCGDLMTELKREGSRGKFTFAELEENEEDLAKLGGWLQKIRERDLFQGHLAEEAAHRLEACRAALDIFARTVYSREGIEDSGTPHS